MGKTAVRFSLKVKVAQLVLPGVSEGCSVFVLLERGKGRKSWTKPLMYVNSTASKEARDQDKGKWAEETLEIPITLYRGTTGAVYMRRSHTRAKDFAGCQWLGHASA
jgi:hypothetical protein